LPILIYPVTPPKSPKKEVFMMRAEGQSWEDYKKAIIESLRAKGMLAEPEINLPDEKLLKEQFPKDE